MILSAIIVKKDGYRVKPGMTNVGFGFVFSCLPAAVLMVVLTVASCTSNQGFNEIYTQVTELLSLGKTSLSMWLRASSEFGHLFCYALFSLALSNLFSRQHIFVAPLVAVSFGLLMEGAQIFIPTRGASLTDVGINVLGVVIGFGLYLLWVVYMRGGVRPHLD